MALKGDKSTRVKSIVDPFTIGNPFSGTTYLELV